MEKQELQNLISSPTELAEKLKGIPTLFNSEDYLLYEPENHAVMSPVLRKKKEIQKPDPTAENPENTVTQHVEVCRVPIAMQKLIVNRATVFLTGNPVKLVGKPETDAEETLFAMVQKVWEDNKLDYRNMPIAEAMMSEREVAEVWFMQDTEPGYWGDLAAGAKKKIRMIPVKPSEGNSIWPLFDNYRDMVGFARSFKVKEGDEERVWLDVYTPEKVYEFKESEGGFIPRDAAPGSRNPADNPFGKVPVIYYSQPRSEWLDVQVAISRLEDLLSNHGDINDYNGSPTIIAQGKIVGFSAKGERGKVLEVEQGGDVKYLSWDAAPESIKLEIENLFDIIYTITQTPNISFKEVKGMGNLSGIALKLMFLDAHSKARKKQSSVFGECMQRRINLIKAGCAKINPAVESALNMDIWPEFTDYMPVNELENAQVNEIKVRTLKNANNEQALMSQQTSIEQLDGYEIEPGNELELIQKQEKEASLAGGIQ